MPDLSLDLVLVDLSKPLLLAGVRIHRYFYMNLLVWQELGLVAWLWQIDFPWNEYNRTQLSFLHQFMPKNIIKCPNSSNPAYFICLLLFHCYGKNQKYVKLLWATCMLVGFQSYIKSLSLFNWNIHGRLYNWFVIKKSVSFSYSFHFFKCSFEMYEIGWNVGKEMGSLFTERDFSHSWNQNHMLVPFGTFKMV